MERETKMKIAVTGGTGFLGQYVVESIKMKGILPSF